MTTLLGIELVLRYAAPQSPADMFVADPKLGFRLSPNYRGEDVSGARPVPLAFNAWGLRDRDYTGSPVGHLRVYVLGDSFIFGHGVRVEDTFTKVLERTLRSRPGFHEIEVVNGGVPRYGTLQEIGLFDETVDLVRPDVVVLGLYVGNDVLDNIDFARQDAVGGDSSGGLVGWLRVRSQLYMWLRRQHHISSDRMDSLQRAALETFAVHPSADIERGMVLTEEAIDGLARQVRERGMRFALVLIPSGEQVHANRWQATLERYGLVASGYDSTEPNRRFAAFASQHRIPLLDLLPSLRARAQDDLYFTLHWNARGHALAAAATAEFMITAGLIGAPANPGAASVALSPAEN